MNAIKLWKFSAYHSTSLFTRAFDTLFEKCEGTEHHN